MGTDLIILLLQGALIALLISAVVYLSFIPMNRIRTQDHLLGFAHVKLSGQRRKEYVNRLRKLRYTGKIPPAYPNGWYAVAESRELPPGTVQHVAALGRHFAVFRGQTSGKVHVINAYCPVMF